VKTDLHKRLMKIAHDETKNHIEIEEDEKCFNLFTFLQGRELRLCESVDGKDSLLGNFQLSASDVARYLWCCLAIEAGGSPDGSTYKDMPILE
jgi:hypothetical protein